MWPGDQGQKKRPDQEVNEQSIQNRKTGLRGECQAEEHRRSNVKGRHQSFREALAFAHFQQVEHGKKRGPAAPQKRNPAGHARVENSGGRDQQNPEQGSHRVEQITGAAGVLL